MALPLEGITVVELGGGVATPFAGKLLAELGADVVKVEPPDGDPARALGPFPGGGPDPEASALFLYLNTAKRSFVLDVDDRAGRETLHRLLARADALLHDCPPARARALGIDPEALPGRHPRLIACAVTPFGLTGPYAELPATDLTVQALCGYMSVTGDPGRAPLMGYGYQAQYQAGQAAAIGVLAMLEARHETGAADYLDVSWLEAMGGTMESRIAWHSAMGARHLRMGNRLLNHGPLVELYPTRDGFVAIAPQAEHQWEGMCVAIGHPEWRDREDMDSWDKRASSRELEDAIREWFRGLTTVEAMEQLQMLRVPSAPVLGCRGVLEDPQVQARGVFVEVDHPAAGRLPYVARWFHAEGLSPRAGRAPLLGEHTAEVMAWLEGGDGAAAGADVQGGARVRAARGGGVPGRRPLDHVRVLDLTQAYAGPFGGEILRALGAEVIHVESHLRPDVARFINPMATDGGHVEDRGLYFSQHNQGKLDVNLNLAAERGRQVMLRMIPQVDAVLNNFSARVMENWGFTLEALTELNPRIVLVGMPSFGGTGPQSGWVCYGEALEAASGLVQLRGYGPAEPRRSGIAYPDAAGGVAAACALLAGLAYRRQAGRGVAIDLSQRDACSRLLGEAFLAYAMTGEEPGQWENRHHAWAPHGVYRAAGEDRWLAIAVRDDGEWRALCAVIGREDLAGDSRFATAPARLAAREEIDRVLGEWAARQDPHRAQAQLMAAGVPAGAVLEAPEVIRNEQFASRGFHPEIDHPVIGPHRVHLTPYRFIRGGPPPAMRAPLFDEHTREVLARLAGVTDAEYSELVAGAVTGQRPEFIAHQ